MLRNSSSPAIPFFKVTCHLAKRPCQLTKRSLWTLQQESASTASAEYRQTVQIYVCSAEPMEGLCADVRGSPCNPLALKVVLFLHALDTVQDCCAAGTHTDLYTLLHAGPGGDSKPLGLLLRRAQGQARQCGAAPHAGQHQAATRSRAAEAGALLGLRAICLQGLATGCLADVRSLLCPCLSRASQAH
jgi:hypothetical protein